MGKFSTIIDSYSDIHEKLVVVNKGKRQGQLVILAGGSGSGKSSVAAKQMALDGYKFFNIDDIKPLLIKLAKAGKQDPSLKDLDLSKPEDAAKMHQFVSKSGLFDRKLKTFVDNIKRERGLPNIVLDMTFKNPRKAQKRIELFQDIGYKPENTHLAWVLTNFKVAIDRSKQRGRDVPFEVMFDAHRGVGKSLYDFMVKGMPKNIDGEFYVILNNDDSIIFPKGEEKKPWSLRTFKDFTYLKIKDAGKRLKKKLIQDKVLDWVKDNIPKEVLKELS